MNLKSIFLALLLALPLLAVAQTIELSGTVKDSIGNPLELANIIATDVEANALESYAITDGKGRYKLDLTRGKTYELKVSYLGLKSAVESYTVTDESTDDITDFTLVEDPNQLDNVELVYEIPITVRGDTIVYNTDSFTNGTERKLGDVIEKLPGVELTDDGEIEVDGQTVSKVMIDGKDFFDGDSKLATKNIPADALKKVEVLRNYNEVSQLRGLGNDQDNIAINLKLKEGKENFWFGEINGGLGFGDETRYRANPKIFYYSPKGSVSIISDFNNVGEVPFTFRDYFNFTGGFRGFNQRGGTNFNVSESGLSFLTTQNNRAANIEADFIASNFTYAVSPKWDISGFAILSDNRTDFVNESLNTFINQGFTQEFNETSDQRNRLAMAKFSSVYKPTANLQIDYDVLAKTSDQTEFSDGISITTVNGAPEAEIVDQNKENSPFSINQNLKAYYTLNENNIFAFEAQHLYQEEDPFYQALLSEQPFSTEVPLFITDPTTGEPIPNPNPAAGQTLQTIPLANDGSTLFDINQEQNIRSNKTDAKLDYYWVLNKKSNLNFTLGTTQSRQHFDSGIFETLDNISTRLDNTVPDQDTGDTQSLLNAVKFQFSDIFLGLHYKVKTGKVTWTPGLTLHNFRTESDQNLTVTTDDKWLALPDLFVNVQFGQSQSLRFNYQVNAQYTDVGNYAEGLIFNNFNSLYRGNRELENAIFHNISANYFSFSMFNFTNFFGGVNYSRRIDPIKTVGIFNGINQISSPINNSNFADETLSANGRFSKTFKKWRLNLSGNLSYSNLNNIINGLDRQTENFSQNYRASFATNFDEAPNLEVGFNRVITDSDNGVSRVFTTDRPFANFEWAFGEGFTLTADWEYFNYDDDDDATDIDNNYQFLEAALFYKKPDSKWEFSIEASNLFDVDVISQNTVNDITISNTEFFVQPRIVLFTTRYNL